MHFGPGQIAALLNDSGAIDSLSRRSFLTVKTPRVNANHPKKTVAEGDEFILQNSVQNSLQKSTQYCVVAPEKMVYDPLFRHL